MQGMAVSGFPAARASSFTVTIVLADNRVEFVEVQRRVLKQLDLEQVAPTGSTPITGPPRGLLCSFADAATTRRANDTLRGLSATLRGAFTTRMNIVHPSNTSGGGGARRADRQLPFGRHAPMDRKSTQIIPNSKSKHFSYHSDRPAEAGAAAGGTAGALASRNGAAAAADAVAAADAAAEPVPPPPPAPGEPAGSSQLARMGGYRRHRPSSSMTVDRPSRRPRDDHRPSRRPSDDHRPSRRPRDDHRPSSHKRSRERGPDPRRAADERHIAAEQRTANERRTSGERSRGRSGRSCRHCAPSSHRAPGERLRAQLCELRPYASNCRVAAPRRRGAEQPFSGSNEMYIVQQRGDACGIKNVGNLQLPLLLCDSLAGARILRAVAALLHLEFCAPTPMVTNRLKRCYEMLLPDRLQRALIADCRTWARRAHCDVSRRDVEDYLARVVHRMVARR